MTVQRQTTKATTAEKHLCKLECQNSLKLKVARLGRFLSHMNQAQEIFMSVRVYIKKGIVLHSWKDTSLTEFIDFKGLSVCVLLCQKFSLRKILRLFVNRLENYCHTWQGYLPGCPSR